MENQINRFRLTFLILIFLLDLASYFILMDDDADNFKIVNTIISIVSVAAVIYVHFVTRKKKYIAYIKYAAVTSDMTISFAVGYLMIFTFDLPLPISSKEFALLMTLIFMFFNTLSAIRANRNVIIFSTLLAVFYNTLLFVMLDGKFSMLPFYTSFFLLLNGVFCLWVGRYIIENFIINKQIIRVNSNLEEANTSILQQNEEIRAQKDEIETQRDYISEQKDIAVQQRDEIGHQKKLITDSIEYAVRIQQAILPSDDIFRAAFPESFVFFRPKDVVSGDLYWMEEKAGKKFVAAIDCTGHGVPGAFMSIVAFNLLNQALHEHNLLTPGEILDYLSAEIYRLFRTGQKDVKDGMDLALCAVSENETILEFAGVNNPAYLIRGSDLYQIKPDRQPIGDPFAEGEKYQNTVVALQKGDMVYMYSDGYVDQFGGPKRKKFLSSRFRDLLLEINIQPADDQIRKVREVYEDWKGKVEQYDDVLVLGFRIG